MASYISCVSRFQILCIGAALCVLMSFHTAHGVSNGNVLQLAEMGYPVDAVRAALAASDGNVEDALELLMSARTTTEGTQTHAEDSLLVIAGDVPAVSEESVSPARRADSEAAIHELIDIHQGAEASEEEPSDPFVDGVSTLTAMGYSPARAKIALTLTGGNVQSAVDYLCGHVGPADPYAESVKDQVAELVKLGYSPAVSKIALAMTGGDVQSALKHLRSNKTSLNRL